MSKFQPYKSMLAALVAGVMTLVVLLLRVFVTPLLQDPDTGHFRLSAMVIVPMVLTVAAVGVLAFFFNRELSPVRGRMLMPTSLAAILCGVVMILQNGFDLLLWVMPPHITPEPNPHVVNTLDGIVLFCTILFGILGGLFLICLGLRWLSDSGSSVGIFRLGALAPVVWMWMRLARYQMSYASAVDVSESFYDFVMLIAALLFFFALARYISGVGGKTPRFLLLYTLSTGLFSVSGTVARMAHFLMGQSEAFASSRLASASDLAVGLFALLLGFSFCLPARNKPASRHPSAAQNTERMPTVDDIL